MLKTRLTKVLALVLVLICFGCARDTKAAPQKLAPPVTPEIVRVNPVPGETDLFALPTPHFPATPENVPPPVLTEQVLPSFTPSPATPESIPATNTPTPTAPPPLPLRDDLEPLELQDFPRPENDNGLGIHFVASGYYDEAELDKQIARMKQMNLKWATVVYTDENHLEIAARKFSEAGIFVVWRKTLKPYQRYSSWQRDIDLIKKYNLPPYMQLYNEAELEIEWDDQEQDRDLYFQNLLSAAKDVYNAGGYPGIQFLDEDWLREFINQVYARKGEALFKRMFFIPHAYGVNHPPDYQEDPTGVLGFRSYATIFFKRLGFVPPFIIGEGGWKIEAAEDNRFPAISDELHRDYTLKVYDWFRSGKLSHGGDLPDYLFAFNMWMIAGLDEAGAWYDSFKGDRTLTIDAVQKIPPFVRKFSWDE